MMETAADRTAVFQHSRPGEDKVMENAVVSEVGASPAVAGQRGGFTLVELLVVIAIMAILMALLVPAVQGVREMARQRICRGNLQMLANGVARYEDSLGYVPGWRNADSSTFGPVCWPIALLPYIEQTPVYDAFQSGGVPAVATAQIGSFLCPAAFPQDIAATPAQTSYAGNVGLGTVGQVWTGMMNDTTVGTNRIRLSDIDVADGTAWTLLLAEKCGPTIVAQAVWTGTARLAVSGSFLSANGSTWIPAISTVLAGQPDAAGRTRPVFGLVYGGLNLDTNNTNGNLPINGPNRPHTVPSSAHNGGAMVAFCDGRTQFLRNIVDAGVYAQLVTASHSRAGNVFGWTAKYPLSDADLRELK
jgi:prepilin-type N-terminal cleavage/methylation domain-containing protein/prepilin-type processing-associated H-X9-DG protein